MDNKNTFLEFAESLKLVRKTRIEDYIENSDIDDIYTDLLPNNGIINKLNLPRTTILVGRKGTGKSTIFQKSQKDLMENKKCISIYIDVKTLYDNSVPPLPQEVKDYSTQELHKYLIYSNFIKEIVLETKNRLNDFFGETILSKFFGFNAEKMERIQSELELIESSIIEVIKNVDLSLMTAFKNSQERVTDSKFDAKLELSKNPGLTFSSADSVNAKLKTEFESTLVNYLDIKNSLIKNLTKLKQILEIEHLYIFLDDYSEIDEDAQKIFMDWFIAPLNNLSDDFVKFKIAVYPNRFYYGKLDNSKIDEISLEFFDAFYSFEKKVNISKMETLALDYTKRLLKKRLAIFFPANHWDKFFLLEEEELFNLLFSVSFNNPRKIGYILSYCYESSLIHNEKISISSIENASQRYYTDVVLKYFLANQFVTRPFNDKISNEHQFDLLNKIIEKQKHNTSSAYRSTIKGKPGNHFTITTEMTHLLDNLELNGFITTYNKNNDNNGETQVMYSLDHGLSKRNGLNFQRAYDAKMLDYFSLSRFNMNILVVEYFNKTQVLKCSNGHEFPFSMNETLKKYKMRCPDCLDADIISKCEVTISNIEIIERLKEIENSRFSKITFPEFQILDYLKTASKTVSLIRISTFLDKSESIIKKNLESLASKDLIKYDLEVSKKFRKDYYFITEKGENFVVRLLGLIKKMEEKS